LDGNKREIDARGWERGVLTTQGFHPSPACGTLRAMKFFRQTLKPLIV